MENARPIVWAKRLNIALSLAGLSAFLALFIYVSAFPNQFDRTVRTMALAEVERRVDDRLNEVADSRATDLLVGVAGAISPELGDKADEYRSMLAMESGDLIGQLLIAACRLDCENRQDVQSQVEEIFRSQFGRYRIALDRLQTIVVGEYDEVMQEFRADIRTVALANMFAFAFALILALVRTRAAPHLLIVSSLLSVSTIAMFALYLFGQNWASTIIFGEYWGWTYAGWLAFLCALLADIAFNKARIVTGIGNAAGGALSAC
ncbi:hypothetical protein [uncultured Parasphingopyxis sp.]|uniref:hypothetical protein n=1 Tax=uncultured Parasphingopyxis sp. TaxID=1547918 RepID=UPI0026146D6F|nr:hypothetical protein [uncultured Parasphingopyxis sp.]